MPEVGEVFQEVFFVEAKPPEANEIASAQADAVKTIHLEQFSCVPFWLSRHGCAHRGTAIRP